MSGNGDRPGPGAAQEAELVAAILAFCRQRAIAPADPEADLAHEQETWRAIQAAFASRWQSGDFLGFLDDHYKAILAAMFTPAEESHA